MKPEDRYEQTDRNFEDVDYVTRRSLWFAFKWIAGAIIVILFIVTILWGLGVFSSGVKNAATTVCPGESEPTE